jgi:hypothetical protein
LQIVKSGEFSFLKRKPDKQRQARRLKAWHKEDKPEAGR